MEIRAPSDTPCHDAVSSARDCQPCAACCTWLPIPAGKVGRGGGGNVEVIINNNSGVPATKREVDIGGKKRIFVEIV